MAAKARVKAEVQRGWQNSVAEDRKAEDRLGWTGKVHVVQAEVPAWMAGQGSGGRYGGPGRGPAWMAEQRRGGPKAEVLLGWQNNVAVDQKAEALLGWLNSVAADRKAEVLLGWLNNVAVDRKAEVPVGMAGQGPRGPGRGPAWMAEQRRGGPQGRGPAWMAQQASRWTARQRTCLEWRTAFCRSWMAASPDEKTAIRRTKRANRSS